MDDVTRRRIAALLLVVGVVIAALAIADLGPFDDPPTEEERVQAVVEDFFGAAADGDSRRFCALLTEDARDALRTETARRIQAQQLPSCVQILDLLKGAFAGSQVSIREVSVSGNQARVEARFRPRDGGAQPRTILLLEEGEEWRVSDLG